MIYRFKTTRKYLTDPSLALHYGHYEQAISTDLNCRIHRNVNLKQIINTLIVLH